MKPTSNDSSQREIEIVRMHPAAQRRSDLVDLLLTRGPQTFAAPETEMFQVAHDGHTDDVVVVLLWRSAADHQRRLAHPSVAALFAEIAALSAGPPTIELLRGVRP